MNLWLLPKMKLPGGTSSRQRRRARRLMRRTQRAVFRLYRGANFGTVDLDVVRETVLSTMSRSRHLTL